MEKLLPEKAVCWVYRNEKNDSYFVTIRNSKTIYKIPIDIKWLRRNKLLKEGWYRVQIKEEKVGDVSFLSFIPLEYLADDEDFIRLCPYSILKFSKDFVILKIESHPSLVKLFRCQTRIENGVKYYYYKNLLIALNKENDIE